MREGSTFKSSGDRLSEPRAVSPLSLWSVAAIFLTEGDLVKMIRLGFQRPIGGNDWNTGGPGKNSAKNSFQ